MPRAMLLSRPQKDPFREGSMAGKGVVVMTRNRIQGLTRSSF